MREAHTPSTLAPTGACRYAERRSADWLAQLSAQLDEATLAVEALLLFSAVGFVDTLSRWKGQRQQKAYAAERCDELLGFIACRFQASICWSIALFVLGALHGY